MKKKRLPVVKKTSPFERIRVLLVASKKADVTRVREILSDENAEAQGGATFELEVTDRLEKALMRFEDKNLDAVLTDLTLPDSVGMKTFTSLHETALDVPIIILSESEDREMAFEAVRRGAHDYLSKAKLNANNLPRILRYAVERFRIQRQIFLAEQKYRSIFENSAAAIIVTDEKDCVVSWNPFAEKLLGMKHEDLYLKPMHLFYPAKEWEKLKVYDLRHQGIRERIETKMICKDGRVLEVDLSMNLLRDPSGQVTGLVSIIRDITEQKRLENLKDEFLSTVSHELRTPLAIVREAVSQVLEGLLGETNREQRKFLSITLENIDRLTHIVNDLLDISKLESGSVQLEKERVNFSELVEKVCDSFEARARRKEIKMVVRSAAPVMELYLDRDKIIQVMTNLIGNAVKFMESGRIDVSVEDLKEHVQCSVRDTGKGISPEDLPKVFNKFQQFGRTAGPGEKGTGLGLAISKGIVELHCGKIWVESELGKGSKVTFTLPKSTALDLFKEKITSRLAIALREQSVFSVMIVQLDPSGFPVKQKKGRETLQMIIRKIEEWIYSHLPRRVDVVVEYPAALMMIFPGIKKEDALIAAGRIKQVLEEFSLRRKLKKTMGLNYQVATFPSDGQTVKELLDKISKTGEV